MTLPTLLTLFRIVLIVPIVGLFFVPAPWAPWAALALYAIAAITDYFDGYLARLQQTVTVLGQFLDPIADKLLVAAVLLMLVGVDQIQGIHILPAIVILMREILISGLREFLAGMTIDLPVSRLAKWKTTIQMLALGFLIVGTAAPDWLPAGTIGIVALWIAAVLTVQTCWAYLRTGLARMIES